MKEATGNDRWLTDGNCLHCRRADYCGKPCKAQKKRKEAILEQMRMRRAIVEQMGQKEQW